MAPRVGPEPTYYIPPALDVHPDGVLAKKGTSSIQINQVGYPKPPQGVTCEWCYETLDKTKREGDEWK
jgi:hypothetical protein